MVACIRAKWPFISEQGTSLQIFISQKKILVLINILMQILGAILVHHDTLLLQRYRVIKFNHAL